MKKLILCIILLLVTVSFSSANAARVREWPAGQTLAKFKNSLPEEWTDWVRAKRSLNSWEEKNWYVGKLFYINTETSAYTSVKILYIITLGVNNVMLVFENNGSIMYVPFNRIRGMMELKQ